MAANNVVVGYDTSPESRHAVTWAALAAERRQAPLVVLSATGWVRPPAGMQGLSVSGEQLAYRTAEEGAKLAREAAPNITVEAVGAQNTALAALESFSMEAQLIVVGHRGAGALRWGQLGSVAFAIANHANCPVAVIRNEPRSLPTAEFPSVVAVDGSRHSLVALEKAAAWASETASLLRIVNAWRAPLVHPWSSFAVAEDNRMNLEAARRAEASASEVVDQARAQVMAKYPDLNVETVIDEGRPAEVIVDAAKDASLIIIGARGRGDVASLLLGSVSREVIEHADCAVYVVR